MKRGTIGMARLALGAVPTLGANFILLSRFRAAASRSIRLPRDDFFWNVSHSILAEFRQLKRLILSIRSITPRFLSIVGQYYWHLFTMFGILSEKVIIQTTARPQAKGTSRSIPSPRAYSVAGGF
jgi:hypothetical protein